ncbi:MAG: 2-dehydropantoate 2-reductase [Clostridia bacterium]|nr:2-dehydropantoate 2-reductase [Clostridia bacterium]
MKIAVLGAGAMGSLYGGLLAEPGNEVWLIDVWKEHVDAINQEGLYIDGLGGGKTIKNIKASTNTDNIGIVDCALIFVKSIYTDAAVSQNKAIIGENTIILTLQNGLGNIEKINQVVDEKNIIAGTTAHGSTMIAPGKIKHAGQGKTIIGELDGKETDRITKLKKSFNDAQLDTVISNNVIGLIWDKLLVNVGINALTAITGLKNGRLVQSEETEWILEEAVKEAEAIAKAKGVKLGFDDPVDHTKKVCEATAANRSSMLQDVERKRETEIDMINGAIVSEGKKVNIATPVNQVLTNLIKVKTRY